MEKMLGTVGARLSYARELRKLTQPQLADLSGVKQSDISKIERGKTQQPRGLVSLAAALRVDPVWLDLGEGTSPDEGAFHAPALVDQSMSYQRIDHPTLTGGEVMTRKVLPPQFKFVLEDNAMGAAGRVGEVVIFSALKPDEFPEYGDGVMVKTADGRVLVRFLAEGPTRDDWRAVAENSKAYRDLYRAADGLELVAVWETKASARLSRR